MKIGDLPGILLLHWYLEAIEWDSLRAEPFQKIAHYYRIHGQHNLAYTFAKVGSQIPYPKKVLYSYQIQSITILLDEEISITALYTPFIKRIGIQQLIGWC